MYGNDPDPGLTLHVQVANLISSVGLRGTNCLNVARERREANLFYYSRLNVGANVIEVDHEYH